MIYQTVLAIQCSHSKFCCSEIQLHLRVVSFVYIGCLLVVATYTVRKHGTANELTLDCIAAAYHRKGRFVFFFFSLPNLLYGCLLFQEQGVRERHRGKIELLAVVLHLEKQSSKLQCNYKNKSPL